MRPAWQKRPRPKLTEAMKSNANWGKAAAALPTLPGSVAAPTGGGIAAAVPAIDRTAKLYIGGKQARPDGADEQLAAVG